jgi:poly-D-alanine transfer protein DltD
MESCEEEYCRLVRDKEIKREKNTMWIEHDGTFYNLDKFNQICRGDDTELLLANIPSNGDWDSDDLKNICVFTYEDKVHRELAYDGFRKILDIVII